MADTLKGKHAVITGAASGLGAELTRELCEAGCRVTALDVQAELLASVCADLDAATPELCDLADADAIAEGWRRFGDVDILVNNAGVDHTLPVIDMSVADIDHVLDVNLRAPFLMSREALRRWKKRGTGDIVNICSTASKRAWPNATAYHASKWGLLGLSHALHVEARRSGIRVTAIVVGGMRTPFILERFPDTDVTTLQDPATVASAVRAALELPTETVVPEMMLVPMRETSWP